MATAARVGSAAWYPPLPAPHPAAKDPRTRRTLRMGHPLFEFAAPGTIHYTHVDLLTGGVCSRRAARKLRQLLAAPSEDLLGAAYNRRCHPSGFRRTF